MAETFGRDRPIGYRDNFFRLLHFSKYLLPYWDKQAALYLSLGFSVLFGLIQPYLTRLIIDFALLRKDIQLFNIIVIIGVVLYLLSVPVEVLNKYISFYIRTKVSFALRARFYRHLHMLSLRFARSRPTGEHLFRLGADIENVVSLVVDTMPSLIMYPFRVLALFCISLWLNWELTLAVLAVSPLIYLHARFFGKRQYIIGKEITFRSQDVASRLQEALASITLIKIFGKERSEHRRYVRDIIQLIRLGINNLKLTLVQGESSRLFNAVIVGGISYLLGYQVIKGHLTLGMMTALTIYLFQLLSSLKAGGSLYNDIILKFISMERVVQTLDEKEEVTEKPHARRVLHPQGKIAVDDVSFGYNEGVPVVRNIRFSAFPGETIALVGPSGAGKTTLSCLMIRLYDPWTGRIAFDSQDVRDLRIQDLRRNVVLVPHEPYLLKQTVRDNLRFGNPEATEQEVVKAAQDAMAHDFITGLPSGYDTEIGEGGHILSQGQKQRIAIARALIMNPRILIIDEGMAAVDSECEYRILRNLKDSGHNRLTILISHRLSTVRLSDRILVFEGGMIAEEGTHRTLVEKGGIYNRLFSGQFSTEDFMEKDSVAERMYSAI